MVLWGRWNIASAGRVPGGEPGQRVWVPNGKRPYMLQDEEFVSRRRSLWSSLF